MIFSLIALTLFMAVFITTNVLAQSAQDLALAITLHADAEAGIPEVDRNGNKWSWEQLRVLRAFAKAIHSHNNGGKPISIAVSAVAGSGKTSLLQGMTHIVAKLCPQLLTAMTAFNTHIASSSKDILIQFKSTDGLNIKVFGNSNTVNAAGHQLLTKRANAEGFSRIDLQSYASDRYVRIARLTLAGWLGRQDRLPLLEKARSSMEVKTTSHAFNNMIGEGLVKAAQMAMDDGYVPSKTVRSDVPSPYVPPTPDESDVKALLEVIQRVGINQSWDENPARGLGDKAVMQLVVEILAVAIETAFMKVELKPFCGDGKTHMDAVIPNKNQRGWWEDALPLSKLIRSTDPATRRKAEFAILEGGGCRFPAASTEKRSNGVQAVSFDTEAKAIVKKHNGHVIMSFENGGHMKRVGGKAIGSQFGNNGNHRVDGEFISSWRRYDASQGITIIKDGCVEKVVAFLAEKFGDEFHNMLDDGSVEVVQHEIVEGGKGTLVLSMADQIYLPHALDLQMAEHEKADCVFIDEVQDLSILKANLVWRLVKDDAHKVMVGDFRQSIYGFCGADSSSFERNAERIGATFYPQTICWRGTEMVAASARLACERFVAEAKRFWANADYPDYDAHRSPLEAGYDWWQMGAMPIQITPSEVVKAYHKSVALHGDDTTFGLLCRLKKPLADYIKFFIKNGIPISTPSGKDGLINQAFNIAGKTRSQALDESYAKVNSKAILGLGWHKMDASKVKQHSLLLRDVENIKNVAIGKYTDMFKGDTKSMAQSTEFQELMGNIELLEAFVSLHRSNGGDAEVKGKNLKDALMTWVEETLFSERGGNAVHVATIHRYKGDEADVMFIVNEMEIEGDDGEPKPQSCFMAKRAVEASEDSAIEEVNMGYVAFTRAKKQNIIINVELQGQLCSDVEQRLQAAFDRDVEALTTDTVQEPQDTPESDSGATDEDSEYVEIERGDGEVIRLSMKNFFITSGTENWKKDCQSGEVKEARHMVNGELKTTWAADDWVKAELDDRCVECSTIIVEGEEHGTCAKCGGHLCRVRIPTHSKSGKYKKHMGGEINDFKSCGSFLENITFEDMMSNDRELLESKRLCSSCDPKDVDDETDWEHELEYVELETHEGKVICMSMEDFDAWEDHVGFEGVKEARHMSEGEVQGTFFQDTTPEKEDAGFFETVEKGEHRDGSKKRELLFNGERIMTYRFVEGDYINMMLTDPENAFFWRRPSQLNSPLKWVEDTLKASPSISQHHAVYYLNQYTAPKVNDIHAFVIELFKEWVHTKWDGHWIAYDVDSDDPAKGLPMAIDILLKEDV